MQTTGYLAPLGFIEELKAELNSLTTVQEQFDRLLIASGPPVRTFWAQNVWYDPEKISISSISTAALTLRTVQRNWALYSVNHHRRASLIQEQLPSLSAKPRPFPSPLPTLPMGSWTLIDESSLLFSPHCSSPFPNGEIAFEETKAPPSRAYLKLWEALTLIQKFPKPGERCLDMGSCPGGWTWALQNLGARVISVDRAPIDLNILQLPQVEFIQKDAFSLSPAAIGPVDWFFSDVICYPERLAELVMKWMDSGCKRFVCTIKLQGTDHRANWKAVESLARIPGSQVSHLFHNKHELTWIKI